MAKQKPQTSVGIASIVDGTEPLRFTSDVAWDIETAPLAGTEEGESLLNPAEAKVAAIGYYQPSDGRFVIAFNADEAQVLRQFWGTFLSLNSSGARMIGFNIHGFDLPFLIRRSWFHGVPIPRHIMSGGRYWSDTFVDLMVTWRCGSWKEFISLDALSRFLGVGQKNGNGQLFYKLWTTDRKQAVAYLVNDVRLTYEAARRMGLAAA